MTVLPQDTLPEDTHLQAGDRKTEAGHSALILAQGSGAGLARKPQPIGGPFGGRTGRRKQPILRKTVGRAGRAVNRREVSDPAGRRAAPLAASHRPSTHCGVFIGPRARRRPRGGSGGLRSGPKFFQAAPGQNIPFLKLCRCSMCSDLDLVLFI